MKERNNWIQLKNSQLKDDRTRSIVVLKDGLKELI